MMNLSFSSRGVAVALVILAMGCASVALADPTRSEPGDPEGQLWQRDTPVDPRGRADIYELGTERLQEAVARGRLTAFEYPVSVTGLLMPDTVLGEIFRPGPKHPALALMHLGLRAHKPSFRSLDDIESWLGLAAYPAQQGSGPSFVPRGESYTLGRRIGSSRLTHAGPSGERVTGLTYGCGGCHVADFFGTVVVGLTTRFPRANEFILSGKQALSSVPEQLLSPAVGLSPGDAHLLRRLRERVSAVDGVFPLALGLDTSLAHVSLSLTRRGNDGDATRDPHAERNPAESLLRTLRADSKPAVWWNVKYKNRWLSDGSVVSGNPIFTNFLWNELGRGTDLQELETWLEENGSVVQDLTAAVFAAPAPTWTGVFGVWGLDLNAARRGQSVYEAHCARCHGTFTKGWQTSRFASATDLNALDPEMIRAAAGNVDFVYHRQTPVIDVGTDPGRWQGMAALEKLNDLNISRAFGTVIVAQQGYVPPPLLGIFSRYPYLHNNSVPSLCDLLKPAQFRPEYYRARPAVDRARDFDAACVGYPSADQGELARAYRKGDPYVFRAEGQGLTNRGHDEGIISSAGEALLSAGETEDLIAFLKTL